MRNGENCGITTKSRFQQPQRPKIIPNHQRPGLSGIVQRRPSVATIFFVHLDLSAAMRGHRRRVRCDKGVSKEPQTRRAERIRWARSVTRNCNEGNHANFHGEVSATYFNTCHGFATPATSFHWMKDKRMQQRASKGKLFYRAYIITTLPLNRLRQIFGFLNR